MAAKKISGEFDARLRRRTGKLTRAVVMLDVKALVGGQGGGSRQEKVRAVRDSARPALDEIDSILEQHSGHRLANSPNALGGVLVESTPEGIRALASSSHVKAVLEDQGVSLVR